MAGAQTPSPSAETGLMINVAGDSSTGKTTYLGRLVQSLGAAPDGRSRAPVTLSVWGKRDDERARDALAKAYEWVNGKLDKTGERIWTFPVATTPDYLSLRAQGANILDLVDRFLVHVRHNTLGTQAWLNLYDLPGELINIMPEKSQTEAREFRAQALEAIARSAGLLYLLNPGASILARAGHRLTSVDIRKYFQEVATYAASAQADGGPNTLAIPVALCLSQMDRAEHYPFYDAPRDYARRLWPGIEEELAVVLKGPVKWFALSAIGVMPVPAAGSKRTFMRSCAYELVKISESKTGDVQVERRWIPDGTPLGLAEPLTWLLEKLAERR